MRRRNSSCVVGGKTVVSVLPLIRKSSCTRCRSSFVIFVCCLGCFCTLYAYVIKPWSTQAGKYSARMVLWEQNFLSQINILEQFTAIFCNRNSLFFSSIVSDFHWPVSCVIIQVAVFWCCHQEEIKVKTQTSKESHSLLLQMTSRCFWCFLNSLATGSIAWFAVKSQTETVIQFEPLVLFVETKVAPKELK